MKRKGKGHFVIPEYPCGVKYMVRYMDDIVCFGANKRDLKTALERIEIYCSEKLGLEIKKNKQIFPLSKEIPLTEKELAEMRLFFSAFLYLHRALRVPDRRCMRPYA